MSLRGAAELMKTLQRLAGEVREEAGEALLREAQRVEAESRSRTPVDTGALRDSHRIGKPELRSGGDISVAISVGEGVPYAGLVHEDVEREGSKFLESALLESSRGTARRLGKSIDLKAAVRRARR